MQFPLAAKSSPDSSSPDPSSPDPSSTVTAMVIASSVDALPILDWVGSLALDASPPTDARGPVTPRVRRSPGLPLLGEQAHERLTRPHLRGHRMGGSRSAWSPLFTTEEIEQNDARLRVVGSDPVAGLRVIWEAESLVGGSLRARCAVTNLHDTPYVVDGLEVVVPVADHLVECLDFTGRHERERTPQRHVVTDGLWLREGLGGRPGLDAATSLILGETAFTTTRGEVLAVHVAWSGNYVLRLERSAATATTLGGGELLQPGEVVLGHTETYTSPWVVFTAARDGLDGVAASLHTWQRSLPTHPVVQPVVLNVWEAVYFDHDHERLAEIARRAARVGVERFVLDDGWFLGRRDDTAGLGDWEVDSAVWPEGLTPFIDQVHELGMEFGLWFEPEMINPDSALYRAHPDWILSGGDRVPVLERHQLVLDLTRPEVLEHLFTQVSAILTTYAVDYVKWDHNRDLLEAGSAAAGGRPATHAQAEAFYRLLDRLRAAHPSVAWESCASGGGRIDLGVLERVQRVWTSDQTDALARQQIQRWTVQLVAPEYAGAHISSPTSHITGRTLPLRFRAATALFGAFGIEWDLTQASETELEEIADWVARHQRLRPLLHSGRVVRPESADPAVLLHGVVAADGAQALVAHVQLDESAHNRGVWVRVPGLIAGATYDLKWEGPIAAKETSKSVALPAAGPTGGVAMSGADLAVRGFWMPRILPETVTLVSLLRAPTLGG